MYLRVTKAIYSLVAQFSKNYIGTISEQKETNYGSNQTVTD